jgi:anhydro-N-acetylmuramic acid kinase
MTKIAIGLMSGTSCDGVDAALLKTDGESDIDFLGGLTIHYESDLRTRLQEASQHDVPLTEMLRIEHEVTEQHVLAIRGLLKDSTASQGGRPLRLRSCRCFHAQH